MQQEQQPNAEILETDAQDTQAQENIEQPEDLENKEAQEGSEDEQKQSEEENPKVVPDKYNFDNIQMPDGITFDTALAEKFEPIAKKLNLSQEDANELVNMLAEHQHSQLANQQELIAEFKRQEIEASKIEYQKMMNADTEIGGGDKDKQNAYLDIADKGYTKFASQELMDTLQALGLDYHPSVIKHFYNLGKLVGNDSITKTNIPVGNAQNAADILYGQK